MSFFRNIEDNLRKQNLAHIIPIIYYHGVEVQVAYPKDDVITDVYGSEYSGDVYDYSETIKAIIVPEEYTSQYNGSVMYTLFPKQLPVGTIVSLEKENTDHDRRYSIHNYKNYGLTDKVFYRYLMNSVGDQ